MFALLPTVLVLAAISGRTLGVLVTIEEFPRRNCVGGVFTGGSADNTLCSSFGGSVLYSSLFVFRSPSFGQVSCTSATTWTIDCYGFGCGSGVPGPVPVLTGSSGDCVQSYQFGSYEFSRAYDSSYKITCGPPSPSASPSLSPTPSVSASGSNLPSIALRFYSQNGDCLGARNDTYFEVGCRTCWYVDLFI